MKNYRVLGGIFTVLIALLTFSSCSESEEASPNFKEEILGNYTASFVAIPNDIEGAETISNLSFPLEVKKLGDNSLILDGGDELGFKAVKLTNASNGLTFDIEKQTIPLTFDDGTKVNMEILGTNGAVLTTEAGNVTKYHGVYLSNTKSIQATFNIEVEIDADTRLTYQATFTAIKK